MRLHYLEDHEITLLAAIPVGVLAAIATTLFTEALEQAGGVIFGAHGDVVTLFAGLALAWRIVIPTVGGILAGLLLKAATSLQAHQGTDAGAVDYMDAVASGSGRLSVRITLLRALSSFSSIVTGSSVGKEGAMIQLAALCGSLFPAGQDGADTNRRRMLTACGAAAGLATVYHTPLSAAVFVAEVVFGAVAVQRMMPLFLASVAGTMLSHVHGTIAPLYPGLSIPLELHAPTLLAAALLGVLAGVAGALFLRAMRVAKGGFARLPLGLPWRLALGGALVGMLAMAVPEVVGNGYYTIQSILQEHPLSVPVAVVLVAKLLATVLSMGSGAVGGVFTPSLFIGAALGQLMSQGLTAIGSPTSASPLLPLVGMSAFLAATSQAPLMSVLMVFEMTLSPALLLPSMIAAVAAYYTASRCQTLSLYGVVADRTLASAAAERARAMTVAGLCDPTATTIGPDASLAQASDCFADAGTRYLYVTGEDGRMLGALSTHAVQRALRETPDATVTSLMEADFPVLTPDSRLPQALEIFSAHAINRIPLVGDAAGRKLIGTVSKRRVLQESSSLF